MGKKSNILTNGKYTDAVIRAIDEYWRIMCVPPTIRKLMEITGCRSMSHMQYILMRLPGVEIVEGKPVPEWVRNVVTDRKG